MNPTTHATDPVSLKQPTFSRRSLVAVGATALASSALLGAPLASTLSTPKLAYAETSKDVKAQAKAAAKKMAAWQSQLDEASDDYGQALADHDAAQAAAAAAQQRVDADQATITSTQQQLGQRVATMYKEGPFSFLDVLLGATSFDSLSSTWSLLSGVNDQNSALVAQVQAAQADAQQAQALYASQAQVAAQRMADAQAIQAKANKMVKQYKQLSNSLSAKAKKLAQQEAERLLNPPSDSSSQAPKDSNSSDDPVKNPPAPSRSNGMYSSIVAAAYSRLGCPYVSAGNGPAVFDCSGLVRWSYIHAHWYWPDGVRSVAQIRGYALPKGYAHPLSDAQPGDILLLYNSNPYHHHVAIYIGGGKYIQAPEPTKDVEISSWNITRFQYAIRWPKRG